MSKFFPLRRAMLAIAFTLAATVSFGASAYAQSTILVVDQQRVLRDSAVGKHITAQLKSISASMESEVKAQTSGLKPEQDRLVAELKNMSPEALKGRPDLTQRAQTLMEKGRKAEIEAAYKSRELQITEAKAMKPVGERLEVILKQIVAERGADIVLERTLVIYSGQTADITDTVIQRMDQQLRTVPVNRERLPRK